MNLADIAKKYGVTGVLAVMVTWNAMDLSDMKAELKIVRSQLIECYKERYPLGIQNAHQTELKEFAILPKEIKIERS